MMLNLSGELNPAELDTPPLSLPVFVDSFLIASAQWITGTKGAFHLVDSNYGAYAPPGGAVRLPIRRSETGLEIHFVTDTDHNGK